MQPEPFFHTVFSRTSHLLTHPFIMMPKKKRLLLLSVGYGQGHHAAASATAEEFCSRGWECRTIDPCLTAHPRIFGLSQAYYRFCVRRAPALWGITYAMTDAADWTHCVRWPLLRDATTCIEHLLQEWQPDLVICTYPLFAYMLDDIAARRGTRIPYAVIVTDAIAVSSPWMKSRAPLVFVPDTLTHAQVTARYGLRENHVLPAGFPVHAAFTPSALPAPTPTSLRVLYACYVSKRRSLQQAEAILTTFPHAGLTVLAGPFAADFRNQFAPYIAAGRLTVLDYSNQMHRLFATHHVYIGKAGAATVFEAYCARIPLLINFALPGQEQGNLELLEKDGAGRRVGSTAELLDALRDLAGSGRGSWQQYRRAQQAAARSGAAARIANAVERFFFP